MWDLGDVVPLSIEIKNAAGVLEDAGEVRLSVTRPDGTVVSVGVVASTSPGVYSHDFTTVVAGLHRVRWVATGTNAAAFTDVLDVQPAEGQSFISLADLRDHLKVTDHAQDAKLRGILAAVCQVIEDRMGHVTPVTISVDVETRTGTVVLKRPVAEVLSVATLPDLVAIPPRDEALAVDGWTLDAGAGLVTLSRSFGRARFIYRAGRTPLPANFRLAALEFGKHLWRTSQHNTGGGRPGFTPDEQVIPGTTFAMPYNVRQLLGLDKRPQEEVMVG